MTWDWLWWVALVAPVVVNLAAAWQARRRARQLRLACTTLQTLCVAALSLRSQPVWEAWCQSMGDMEVEVRAAGYRWDYDPVRKRRVKEGEQ